MKKQGNHKGCCSFDALCSLDLKFGKTVDHSLTLRPEEEEEEEEEEESLSPQFRGVDAE